jgi:hypothetical protein
MTLQVHELVFEMPEKRNSRRAGARMEAFPSVAQVEVKKAEWDKRNSDQ